MNHVSSGKLLNPEKKDFINEDETAINKDGA
jgi:hypothetical protein